MFVYYTESLKSMEVGEYRDNGLVNLFEIWAVPRNTQVLFAGIFSNFILHWFLRQG